MIVGQQGAIAYGFAAGFSTPVFRLPFGLNEPVDCGDDPTALAFRINLSRPTAKELIHLLWRLVNIQHHTIELKLGSTNSIDPGLFH